MHDGVDHHFEDYEPGRTIATSSRAISADDIAVFSELSHDKMPIHSDLEFARKSKFGGIVAHGTLVLAIVDGLMVRTGLFDHATAFLGLTWSMTAPVRPNDTIRAEIVVRNRRKSRKDPSCGIIEFGFSVVNQVDVLIGKGTWTQQFGVG